MGFKKAKITTTVVESLKPGESVTDTELPGYLVRRQLGEARIYAVRKHANGKRHFETIGEHGREYEFFNHDAGDIVSGYLIYRADFNGSEVLPVVTDGKNQETIAAVQRDCRLEGFVECRRSRRC